MARINALILAASVLMLALGPIAAFANSSKPTYSNCPTCTTSSGTHGGSTNDCTAGGPGCNNVTDTKKNPAGNNNTCTCVSAPDSKCGC